MHFISQGTASLVWSQQIWRLLIGRASANGFSFAFSSQPFATNASGAIWWPKLELMQVAQSGGQICNQCKWRHLVAKIGTNASGAIW